MDFVPFDVNQNIIGLAAGNPKDDPLLTRSVLYKVFEYLKLDTNTLLKCRAVNSEWTKCIADTNPSSFCIYLRKSHPSKVESLRSLLSNPNATLECQNLKLGNKVDLTDVSIISLIEKYGSKINQLTICPSATAVPVMIALKECTHLAHLTIDPLQVRSFKMSKRFQKVWENPLPPLRSFTFHVNRDTYHSYEWEREIERIETNGGGQAVIANLGLERPFDFIVFLLSNLSTVERFSAKNQSLKLWNRLATRLGQRPDLIHRLGNVHLHFKNFKELPYDEVWTHGLNLKVFEVENSKWIDSREFSTLLAHISLTLETLTIQKDKVRDYTENDDIRETLQMIFQNQMPELKEIHLVSRRFSLVDSSAPGNVNLFRQLPKLQRFSTQVKPKKKYAYILKSMGRVWQKLIPVMTPKAEVNPFVHNNLREFCVEWMMPRNNLLVDEIRRCFPNLRKIGLTLQGLMLSEFVQELSDLEIQDVAVTYYGSEDEFASALTGISPLSCKKYERKRGQDFKVEKVRKTFADWISLRKLMIEYNFANANGAKDEEFSPLTDVVVQYGLTKLFQLEKLSLNRFKIRLIQVSSILNQVSLHFFDLSKSRLQGGNETAFQGIRTMFPKVNLNLVPASDEEDVDDFDFDEDDYEF